MFTFSLFLLQKLLNEYLLFQLKRQKRKRELAMENYFRSITHQTCDDVSFCPMPFYTIIKLESSNLFRALKCKNTSNCTTVFELTEILVLFVVFGRSMGSICKKNTILFIYNVLLIYDIISQVTILEISDLKKR